MAETSNQTAPQGFTWRHRFDRLMTVLGIAVTLGLLIAAAPGVAPRSESWVVGSAGDDAHAPPRTIQPASLTADLQETGIAQPPSIIDTRIKIRDLRPGDRVKAENPDLVGQDDAAFDTEVDPATWRLVTLRIDQVWDDGTVEDANIRTLQRASWIEANNVRVGRSAPVPLDLEELGITGEAYVVNIEPCPPIRPGAGRVVLTTVDHLSEGVLELMVQPPTGPPQKLTPTANHPFYDAATKDWVKAGDLAPGQWLSTHAGKVRVLSLTPIAGVHRVYNLTVERDHVYHVSALGVLSHNNYSCYTPDDGMRQWSNRDGGYINPKNNKWTPVKPGEAIHADHVYPKSKLAELDGFEKLTPEQQDWLLNNPGNIEPLPASWNSSKGARLAEEWSKTPTGMKASPKYIEDLAKRQQAFEEYAKQIIRFWNGN